MSKKKNDDDALRAARETLDESGETVNEAREDKKDREEEAKARERHLGEDIIDDIRETASTIRRLKKKFEAAAEMYRVVEKYSRPARKVAGWMLDNLKDAFVWAAYEREKGDLKLDKDGKARYSLLGRAFKAVAGEQTTQRLDWDMFYQFGPSRFKLDADGDKIFNKWRLGKVLGSSMGILLALNLSLHAAYYYGTQFEEVILANGGKQVMIDETSFQFTGCTSVPCDTEADNGKFYRVYFSWYWPRMIYPEEEVFALIPEHNGLCEIEGFGVYYRNAFFRLLYKNFSTLYQTATSVSCFPLTDEQVQDIMMNGDTLEVAWDKMVDQLPKSHHINNENEPAPVQ